jgi:hypothetical protein
MCRRNPSVANQPRSSIQAERVTREAHSPNLDAGQARDFVGTRHQAFLARSP